MRDKQIKEMAKVIKSSLDGLGSGNFNFTGDEISTMFAKALYNAGYRKASDVAREIFEEIDNMLLKCISASHKQLDEAVRDNSHDGMIATTSASEVLKAMRLYIAELKKKYESEGEG